MSAVRDILRTYRAPRQVVAERLTVAREPSTLAVLMIACALAFVAQWPNLSREAHLDPSVPFDARISGSLFALIFIMPLVAYALAGLIWALLRIGGPISALNVRFALFWAFLAASPLWLMNGFMAGFLGDTGATQFVGIIAFSAFVIFTIAGLRAAIATRGDVHA